MRRRWAALQVALVACGRFEFTPLDDGGAASLDDATADALVLRTCSAFSSPAQIPELVSPAVHEWAPHVTRDEQAIYVSAVYGGGVGMQDIWRIRRSASGQYDVLEALPSINSADDDQGMSVTADELVIVFSTARPGLTQLDLWQATRATIAEPFGAPVALIELNTTSIESGPVLSPDGLMLYFSSNRAGSRDLYVTTRPSRTAPFEPPAPIAELNTGSNERSIAVAQGGLEVFVMTNRAGGTGEYDIWAARRASLAHPFGPLEPVPELNTTIDEGFGSMSHDGTTMYFNYAMQTDGSVDADVYVARRTCTP